MKKIKSIVTGGAGFIGGWLVRRLLKTSNARVFNLDKISYASDLSGINKSPNMIQPNKRCNIGHAPIIVFKNNKPYLTVGSPGGFGIIQYLFQVLSHVLNYGIDLQTAIDLPRFRVSNNFKDVFIEDRFKSLSKNKNYNIKSFSEWTDIVGGVEGIVKNSYGNYLNCYDVRRNSQASGFF